MPKKAGKQATHVVVSTVYLDPEGKKIEYEERRARLQKVLEKRRAKSTANHPKDTPNTTENGKKPKEN